MLLTVSGSAYSPAGRSYAGETRGSSHAGPGTLLLAVCGRSQSRLDNDADVGWLGDLRYNVGRIWMLILES